MINAFQFTGILAQLEYMARSICYWPAFLATSLAKDGLQYAISLIKQFKPRTLLAPTKAK